MDNLLGSFTILGSGTCGANRQASHLLGQKPAKLAWLLASKFYTQSLKVGDPLKEAQLIGRILHPLNAICSLSLTTVILSYLPLPVQSGVIQISEYGSTLR